LPCAAASVANASFPGGAPGTAPEVSPMQTAPWQEELAREGMVLLYPERDTCQYELRERVEAGPHLQALLYLRDFVADGTTQYLEQAVALVQQLSVAEHPDVWLTLLRHAPLVDDFQRSLGSTGGLPHAEIALRAALLLRDPRLEDSVRSNALSESRPASRQFYGWGTLLAGLHELHWDTRWAWQRVIDLRQQLPPANQNLFCQLYSGLAVRLKHPDVAELLVTGVSDPTLRASLEAYLRGGKPPSLVATALRNFRHPLRAERANRE
jgi:hypothetical protein